MSATDYQDLANTTTNNNTTYPDATGFALTASSPTDHVSVRDSGNGLGGSDTILVNTDAGGATTFTDLSFVHSDNNLEIGWSVAGGRRTVRIVDESNRRDRVEHLKASH